MLIVATATHHYNAETAANQLKGNQGANNHKTRPLPQKLGRDSLHLVKRILVRLLFFFQLFLMRATHPHLLVPFFVF